jgi:putative (di)nucleoside polyphosphate hydrolase
LSKPYVLKIPDPAYRACVGLALFNAAGLVFMGRRANKALREHVAPNHEWQMPQGGIDAGEDPRKAALRELHEETNVTSVRFLAEVENWLSYDLPADIIKSAWKGRYKGQTQKWFAFRFEGDDREIDIHTPAGGAHKAEFDQWAWRKLEDAPALIIPFKRGVYEEVSRVFAPFAKP